MRMVVKKNVTRVERLTEEIQKYGYRREHRKKLTPSRDELPNQGYCTKKILGQVRRARGRNGQGLPKGKLDRGDRYCKVKSRVNG